LDFFDTGIQFVEKAREVYNNMASLFVNICEKLEVDAEYIMDELKRQPGLEVLHKKEEHIRKLEKERDDLQSQVNWTKGELFVAR